METFICSPMQFQSEGYQSINQNRDRTEHGKEQKNPIYLNALHRSNNRDCFLRAHLSRFTI